MSRTVRALPISDNNRSEKRYATTLLLSIKVHGNGFVTLIYDRDRNMTAPIPPYMIAVSDIVGYRPETEEDVRRYNDREILYWCKKNKTCRRQRKNAVKFAKRAWRKMERARGKRLTRLEKRHAEHETDANHGSVVNTHKIQCGD